MKILQPLLTVLFVLFAFQARSQESVLTISKKTGGIEKRLVAGDYVKVKTTEDSICKGQLVVFDQNSLSIDSITIAVNEIEWLKAYNLGWRAVGNKVAAAGVLYLAVAGITGAIQGYEPIYNENDFIITGSFLVGGGIFLALSQRKFKMSKYEIDFISFQNLNTK
jgi:hypothetical protein